MLRYLTAGESHGQFLTAILEGVPSNLPLSSEEIDRELERRQKGYGRGARMEIERDRVSITSGVRHGLSLGGPITMVIVNRDWENWRSTMEVEAEGKGRDPRPPMTRPRPGHADLAGALKYDHQDLRNVLERSSARETAARVAVGAVCKRLLGEFGVQIISHVVEIGGIKTHEYPLPFLEIFEKAEGSPVRCANPEVSQAMVRRIEEARDSGTSLGGVFEVIALNVPPGLGSYIQWDLRLDGRLAHALMSIQAIKGVEIGLGFEVASRLGSEAHDEIYYDSSRFTVHGSRFYRKTNRAGGLEGGVTNGEPIVLRAAMKPIATQYKPLASVDLITKEPTLASVERADICAVPAASIVGEAAVAFEVARAFQEKFGGDSLAEMKRNYESYLEYLKGI
ncbi:MAG: chorismate synthase [candidate division NC10 bacterium]|nr:chorismate synthase [candidate division NC10 bacterium]